MTAATTCQTCRFWQLGNGSNPVGTCCRHAPKAEGRLSGFTSAQWPITWADNWCGEWEARA